MTDKKLTPEQIKKNVGLINEAHGQIEKITHKAFRNLLPYAIEAGQMLEANKEAVGHGNFEKYVKGNHDFSVRTARDYMKCAKNEQKLEDLKDDVGTDGVDSIRKA